MEDGFRRKQFTFYRSFFEAVQTISSKQRRAEVYDALCRYALDGTEPDWENMNPIQKNTMLLVIPVLRSAWEKAKGGVKHGKEYSQDNGKIPGRYGEDIGKISGRYPEDTGNKGEKEKEIENKKEIDIEYKTEGAAWGAGPAQDSTHTFDIFWNLYPRKVCKEQAWQAFQRVDVPFHVLEDAIRDQSDSAQWLQDGGKYIPNPATWLEHRRWEDKLPAPASKEIKASGRLGPEEREAIRRIMAEG